MKTKKQSRGIVKSYFVKFQKSESYFHPKFCQKEGQKFEETSVVLNDFTRDQYEVLIVVILDLCVMQRACKAFLILGRHGKIGIYLQSCGIFRDSSNASEYPGVSWRNIDVYPLRIWLPSGNMQSSCN